METLINVLLGQIVDKAISVAFEWKGLICLNVFKIYMEEAFLKNFSHVG